MSDVATTVWGSIQGREITFPMEVAEMNAATLLFSVPAAAAARLLPGDDFEVVEVAPGTAQLVVALCDYVRNPWGDYDEVNLGFLARPAGAPAEVVGSFVYRMPVNQEFTCEAGNRVMGFPKTVEDIDVTYAADAVRVALATAEGPQLAITLPRADPLGPAQGVEAASYSYLDGVPHATALRMDMGTGVVDPAAVVVELGEGTIADELRSLGLPTTPDLATWGEGLTATFQAGQPLG
ncbi:acetoacetate decarboxylase family protein [Iamia sp. SCSIO 61187]|uniref:acetoacetate decarboxylase family protein n=1 Tax=Iamia sp. SCSIO 61187 TaxID=2722752 RepID=UPI001C62AF4A|nr:acetoacetate decarboxylase family protein [Iamia sp. SCSIO 61187]QYG92886.1 acetoacetate decarboxylase family protein [Iamia sp. SCSIO 61187]